MEALSLSLEEIQRSERMPRSDAHRHPQPNLAELLGKRPKLHGVRFLENKCKRGCSLGKKNPSHFPPVGICHLLSLIPAGSGTGVLSSSGKLGVETHMEALLLPACSSRGLVQLSLLFAHCNGGIVLSSLSAFQPVLMWTSL